MNNMMSLPSVIIDPHCHGRDMQQYYKTSVFETLDEANKNLISVTAFMPNTCPPITTLETERVYNGIINKARNALNIERSQYLWFGVTDTNLNECCEALKLPEVIGLKGYAKGKDGSSVTTGTIGIMEDETILRSMQEARRANKPFASHCDDPIIIASEGYTIRAEVEYVRKIIRIGKMVPGVKIVICHVSCRQSAELIIKARRQGMNIMIELTPHHLWFDSDGTNWNPNIDPVFYHCYNKLRSGENREYLHILLQSDFPVYIGSDTAAHTQIEKLANPKLGGIPSNQEMVAVVCTLAKQLGLSNSRVADLLSFNAGKFLNIITSTIFQPVKLVGREVTADYNNGEVENPWKGSVLFFPEPI